jgi:tetratricopeptide (TPR) repeat protein
MSAPAPAAQLIQQGLFHHRQGDLKQAMERYSEVLRTDPANADALYYIAVVACQEGQFQQGAELARRALAKTASARAHNLLGRALEALGEPLEAIKNFDQAIAIDANFAEAHSNRANILVKAELPEEALTSFERALALDPDSIPDLINRGALLQDIGRHAEALTSYDKALALMPDDAGILMNRANALAMLERYDEAVTIYDAVIRRDPKLALAYAHKALAVKELGRLPEARKLFEQALTLAPDDHMTAYGLARLMLTMGDWSPAVWPLFERRASLPQPAYAPLDYPRWNGEPPGDYRLVLLSEQGLGDTVQFARYAALLAGRGHPVTLLTQPVLAPLMRTLPGVERVVTADDELKGDSRPLRWLPLLSVAQALHLKPNAIPEQVPYLSAEPARVARFAGQLGAGGFKVGILWQGVTNATPLAAFAPLAEIAGVRLISLQKQEATREIDDVAFGVRVERPLDADDVGPEALLDTAALMANLDLIVTIESMPAHLAGALGRPVFMALRHTADWRWLTGREDTPWYPNVRLFRQGAERDWRAVFERVAAAVREKLSQSSA